MSGKGKGQVTIEGQTSAAEPVCLPLCLRVTALESCRGSSGSSAFTQKTTPPVSAWPRLGGTKNEAHTQGTARGSLG